MLNSLTAMEKVIGVLISIFTLGGIFVGMYKGIKKSCDRRREKNQMILTTLEKLNAGQECLRVKLEQMDESRERGRLDLFDLRMSQIAVVGAIRELGHSLGVEINGEVKRFHEHNVDQLREYVKGE